MSGSSQLSSNTSNTSNASNASNDSGEFPMTVRDQITELAKNKCWLCGFSGQLHAAHMFGQKEEQTDLWIEKDLVDVSLRSIGNGVALCANCHTEFDTWDDPGFVFFPTDLKYFIRYEKEDKKRRKKDPTLPRKVPSAEEYKQYQIEGEAITDAEGIGGMYIPIILKPRLLAVETSLENEDENALAAGRQVKRNSLTHIRSWHGSPVASLRRGFHILGNPRARMVLTRDQHRDLNELFDLYFPRNPITKPLQDRHRKNSLNEGDSETDNHPPTTRYNPKRRKLGKSTLETPTSKTQTYPRTRGRRGSVTKTTTKVWCPDFKIWVNPYWIFGPEMSSAEIIRKSSRFLLE